MKVAKAQDKPGSPLRLFFDPFAEDIQLYYSRSSTSRGDDLTTTATKKEDIPDEESSEDEAELEELEAPFRYDKNKQYPPSIRQKLGKNATYGDFTYPAPLRQKLSKWEVSEDMTAIQKGTLGPHRLAAGQTIAACVPYSDDESSGSDSGGGGRERTKERWVIAVVVGFDKKKKVYRVKDKYGSEHTSGRGRPRAEISWEVSPSNVCRFPATRHPKCKPKDRVIALWRTKESDSEMDQSDGDEDWTSVFYDATVVDTEQRVGYPPTLLHSHTSRPHPFQKLKKEKEGKTEEEMTYMRYMKLDYGGSSGVRIVRVDKILAIASRQPRRPEKERNIDKEENGVSKKKNSNTKEKQDKDKDKEREKEKKERERERREREQERERERQEKEKEREKERERLKNSAKSKRRPFVMGEIKPGPPLVIELLDDSSIHYYEHLLGGKPSLELYEHLLEAIPWKEENVRVTGAAYLESYFSVWFGEQLDNPYALHPSLSVGIGSPLGNGPNSAGGPNSLASKMPDPWSIVLRELKTNVEQLANCKFNMIHLTYQDGTDYVGGQEEENIKPGKGRHCVATLTLGIDSRVKFSHRTKSHKHDLTVASGSLLVLDGGTAENYTHTLPKVRGASGRIVMTFKLIDSPDFSAFMDVPPTRKRKWGEGEEEIPTSALPGTPSTPSTPTGPATPTTPTSVTGAPAPPITPTATPAPATPQTTPGVPAQITPTSGNATNEEEEAGDEEEEGKEDMALNEVRRGDVPGIFPGTKFSTRVQLLESGVHRILVGTVCGTEAEGAESILLAGASDSDVDNGSEVYFTGAVIINGKTRRKSHSSWKVLRGTQALITSCVRNLPIRVIRSSRLKSPYAPTSGFSFDGLFKVSMYWEEPTKNGHSVWRFKLLGAPPTSQPRLPSLDANMEHAHEYEKKTDRDRLERELRDREQRDQRDREREIEKMREQRDRERERERERDRERDRERERERERDRFDMNGHPSSHRSSSGPSSGVAIFLPPPIPLHSHHTLDPSPLHPLSHTLPPPFPLPHVGSRPFMNLPPSPGLDPFFSSSSSNSPMRGPLQQIPSLHPRTQFPPPPSPHHSNFTQFGPPPYLSPHPPPRLPSFQSSPSHNMSRIWEHDKQP